MIKSYMKPITHCDTFSGYGTVRKQGLCSRSAETIQKLNLFLERNDFMRKVNIKFRDVEQVRQFVNTIDKFDANFDLGSGKKVVDAKSILGVMALDLSGPLCLDRKSVV